MYKCYFHCCPSLEMTGRVRWTWNTSISQTFCFCESEISRTKFMSHKPNKKNNLSYFCFTGEVRNTFERFLSWIFFCFTFCFSGYVCKYSSTLIWKFWSNVVIYSFKVKFYISNLLILCSSCMKTDMVVWGTLQLTACNMCNDISN